MSDYISRQAAIEMAYALHSAEKDMIEKGFNSIPTADVRENVGGNWIRFKNIAECSNCKTAWHDNLGLTKSWSFCPNCGADMRTD